MEEAYKKVQALGEKYLHAKATAEELQGKVGTLEQQNLDLQLNYEKANTQVQTNTTFYQSLQQTHTQLVDEKATLETRVAEVGREVEQVNTAYRRLQQEAETEKTEYEQALTGLQELVSEKEGTISGLSEQIDLFRTQQTNYETEIANYTTKLAASEQQQTAFIDRLEGLLDQYLSLDESGAPEIPD